MDTLWREVNPPSVESFVYFSRVLNPTFLFTKEPSLPSQYKVQYVNGSPTRAVAMKQEQEQEQEQEQKQKQKQEHEQGQDQESDRYQHKNQHQQGLFKGKQRSSEYKNSKSGPSLSSTTMTTLFSLSSLQHPSSPGPIGYAGKGYVRSFSLAGTTDCRTPRPFPYLPSCVMDHHLIAISDFLTHLTSLSLSHCAALTDMAVIQMITASSPYLQQIDLTGCRLITNITVEVIAQLCGHQLEDLSLQGCGMLTDDAIEKLTRHCTRLQKINVVRCPRLGDRSLMALLRASGRMTQSTSSLSKIRTRSARLTKLGIAGCRSITMSGLMAIAAHLTIGGSEIEAETQQQEEAFYNHSTSSRSPPPPLSSSLVSLEFSCPVFKVASKNQQTGHPVLANGASMLNNTRSQARRFFQTLPTTLREIIIHDAHMLSQDDIICLIDRVGHSLKTLRLDNANSLNSETLGHILATCPELTNLCIPRATWLNDAGVTQLIQAKCAQSLVELDISACHALTDECLIKLATADAFDQPHTTTLYDTASINSSFPSSIPPSISLSSSPRASKGKEVLVGASTSTDIFLNNVFPNLQRLNLSYNDKLTLAGIIPLAMSLKNLCSLDVSFCGEGITRPWDSSLKRIRAVLGSVRGRSTYGQYADILKKEEEGSSSDSSLSGDEESLYSWELSHQQQEQQRKHQVQKQYMLSSVSLRAQQSLPETTQQRLQLTLVSAEAIPSSEAVPVPVSVPVPVPSRRGLGHYVGPLLSCPETVSSVSLAPATALQSLQQDLTLGNHSTQGQEREEEEHQHVRRRSSASSTTSTSSISSASSSSSSSSLSSTALSTSSSSSSGCIHPGSFSSVSSLNSSLKNKQLQSPSPIQGSRSQKQQRLQRASLSRVALVSRYDVIERAPRHVGLPVSFFADSWFTPHHHHQLQELQQIQRRVLEAQLNAAAITIHHVGNNPGAPVVMNGAGAEAGAGTVTVAEAIDGSSTAVPILPTEYMDHPIMGAPRIGVATMGFGGRGGRIGRGIATNNQTFIRNNSRLHPRQQQQQQQQQQRIVSSDDFEMQELSENFTRSMRLEPIAATEMDDTETITMNAMATTAATPTLRRHHHRQYQHPRMLQHRGTIYSRGSLTNGDYDDRVFTRKS
ncbi:hypothetical protein BX616_005748 [Lobosporangium transversale]|nr:hypothetical protein BX616_005748 [Lobosporangium transversale]